MYLALIRCPDYPGNVDYKQLLQSYFTVHRITRYLQIDDVITINTDKCPELQQQFEMVGRTKSIQVHFKCTRQVGSTSGLVSAVETLVYAPGHTQFLIPAPQTSDANYSHLESNRTLLSDRVQQLATLIKVGLQLRLETNGILLAGPDGSGKQFLIRRVAHLLSLNVFEIQSELLICDSLGATEVKMRAFAAQITNYRPCLVVLSNVQLLVRAFEHSERLVQAFTDELKSSSLATIKDRWQSVLIGTCDQESDVTNSSFVKLFPNCMSVGALDADERSEVISCLYKELRQPEVAALVAATENFLLSDLAALHSRSMTAHALETETNRTYLDSIWLQLKQMKSYMKRCNNAPTVPDVRWADVGGLQHAKKEIFDAIQIPLKFSRWLQIDGGMRQRGILFWGPPGTGKTLLAKAIANEFGLNFLSVKGPEIINMYVGQSEENLRNLFGQAKSCAPSIVFFDELDSIAPNRGRSGDSGGVMDRLVSTLLSEIDLLAVNSAVDSKNSNHGIPAKPVFVIGATNRPDLLDPALLRPGRFDRLVFVDVPRGTEARLNVLKALTRKFVLNEDCDLEKVEFECPINMTGADFYALCSSAMMNAIRRCVAKIETESKDKNDVNLTLCQADFEIALQTIVPSVSEDELLKYKQMETKLNDE